MWDEEGGDEEGADGGEWWMEEGEELWRGDEGGGGTGGDEGGDGTGDDEGGDGSGDDIGWRLWRKKSETGNIGGDGEGVW